LRTPAAAGEGRFNHCRAPPGSHRASPHGRIFWRRRFCRILFFEAFCMAWDLSCVDWQERKLRALIVGARDEASRARLERARAAVRAAAEAG
jgi:hypothetical protein